MHGIHPRHLFADNGVNEALKQFNNGEPISLPDEIPEQFEGTGRDFTPPWPSVDTADYILQFPDDFDVDETRRTVRGKEVRRFRVLFYKNPLTVVKDPYDGAFVGAAV